MFSVIILAIHSRCKIYCKPLTAIKQIICSGTGITNITKKEVPVFCKYILQSCFNYLYT